VICPEYLVAISFTLGAYNIGLISSPTNGVNSMKGYRGKRRAGLGNMLEKILGAIEGAKRRGGRGGPLENR